MTGAALADPREGTPDTLPAPTTPAKPPGLGELIAPVRGRLTAAIIAQAAAAVCSMIPFIAVAELARALLASGGPDEGRAWAAAWTAVGALVARLVLYAAAGVLTHHADADLQLDLRRRLARHLGRLPLGWFTDNSSGEVKKAAADDISTLHHLVAHTALEVTTALVAPLTALAYLLTVDWRLALVALLPLLLGGYFLKQAMSGGDEVTARFFGSMGAVNAAVVELVHGITVIKAYGRTSRAHRAYDDAADSFAVFFRDWIMSTTRASTCAALALSGPAALLLATATGTLFVTQGWADAVDLVPFVLLGPAITGSVMGLAQSGHAVQGGVQSARRLHTLLAVPPLPEPARPKAPGTDGRVDLEGVSFSYDGTTQVLDGIDLTLRPGTVTALVGASGSGKSTLARLVPRFWDPTAGTVRIGGTDVRDLAPADLYRQVSFVFQDPHLLRTTVRDNIRLGRPDADDTAVERAARAAHVHDRITALPRGYDSVIGEDAVLSGGEAQRLSVARALLADAPVLVLDEATSFADPESEAAVQQALSALAAGRTLLVIAHRLATVRDADHIVVLDGGRVAEQGTHTELLDLDGRYAHLWALQQKGTAR
ncbi:MULTISPECIES: ABC transporter ATP-binding protein [unclassified Streptomyces]|uniref:ABC transporter ATP-binding protein n=1 Tax=unclassified Streptomyces TaxID=2593676 RepID=UPI000DDA0544|nr:MULTISPECIES: ABC transporter ATP-binding protein [unclassified Streptomyces]QZZ31836.1 ABC transporter ATP-binding protein [Streptomyces sp. ST1015]